MPTEKRVVLPPQPVPAATIQKPPVPVPQGSIQTTGGDCHNYGSK
jgi:hypothetical protein